MFKHIAILVTFAVAAAYFAYAKGGPESLILALALQVALGVSAVYLINRAARGPKVAAVANSSN